MIAAAVIVAGGQGLRMGTAVPKQLLKLNGITILERTLIPFTQCPEIKSIVIVAAEAIIEHIKTSISQQLFNSKEVHIVQGGIERQSSVWNGILAVENTADIIVIHDAVRPFITAQLITDSITGAEVYGSVSVMRPIMETVKIVKDDTVIETPDRSTLRITQTPQAFRKNLIIQAHKKAIEDGYIGTDDCMLVERLGYPVHVIEGNDINIKITTPTDLEIAKAILKRFEKREIY
ncbi:MAG: 2-C-methyl-D-erythritol 4-phosphate cytidylyltransferase [Candidatus Latescibacteria bacterium]|nr:2-C-methyl-D-erythritol 4-phosphate cytidylyltransferase [Candidatus Latescibacterota bacterium]